MNLFKTKSSTTPSLPTTLDGGALGGSSSPYPKDFAMPMPNATGAAAMEAARRKRAEVLAKYGRSGTALVSQSGTRPYTNPHLGGV